MVDLSKLDINKMSRFELVSAIRACTATMNKLKAAGDITDEFAELDTAIFFMRNRLETMKMERVNSPMFLRNARRSEYNKNWSPTSKAKYVLNQKGKCMTTVQIKLAVNKLDGNGKNERFPMSYKNFPNVFVQYERYEDEPKWIGLVEWADDNGYIKNEYMPPL